MSTLSLTAKYRPQRFMDVAGQEAIKRILSKAAAQDKIAPAYLFSGTRGVGKTTLARVLAKAINCQTAPTAEPCNECAQCRQITAGISPDVIEIDAATHGGVDEARRLKEDIGYAPLQSRYKVFIIDEAQMLSKAAFNALLKTMEEPPGRVTFILATTEPHKILPTIISRCQHYIFKRLSQTELEAHLAGLLTREEIVFEPSAVSIIARRGAGSVRDSMSLLGQVLALGGSELREQDVRDILGLAGQDVFFALMQAFQEQDCLGVSTVLRQVLDRGLDIGFFLRELASCWRNLFILSQAGEKAVGTLDLSEEEAGRWLNWAKSFEARQIHACWQMTLEGQRRVMTSLEPALALELLLLNLAYLPRLLSLESQDPGPSGSGRPVVAPSRPPVRASQEPAASGSDRVGQTQAGARIEREPQPDQTAPAKPSGPRNWPGFHHYLREWTKKHDKVVPGLPILKGLVEEEAGGLTVRLVCHGEVQRRQLAENPEILALLRARAGEYFGPGAKLEMESLETSPVKNPEELRNDLAREPLYQEAMKMGGQLLYVKPKS
jgi:DNA polymerase-3 subunit gamma/tau